MAKRISQLSIQELRARYVDGDEPVSAHLLGKLQRDKRRGVRQLYEVLRRRHEKERESRLRMDGMLNFERVLWRSGVQRIAGVDEAGVGPLAGPVVAAAVVFPPMVELDGVDDSKKLDSGERTRMARQIRRVAAGIGVGVAEVAEIDSLNIYQAAMLAMRRAVEALPEAPEHVLVDARTIPELEIAQNAFSKGDGINYSIAAASIIAKTERDRIMEELGQRYPGYGLERHKGYSTRAHQEAIQRLGPCPIHRSSFSFIRELCGEYSQVFYDTQRQLFAATTTDELRACERALAELGDQLPDPERRKLRLTLTRRWKLFG